MKKILMVCLGNICRSPLAEGLLKSKVDQAQVMVDSAGTSNYHYGEHPDSRSIEVAQKNGLDISKLRARQFTVEDFKKFDLIYAMDKSNYENILRLAESEKDREKVKLILNEINPGKNQDVPDPYFGGKKGFDDVFDMLDQTTTIIAESL